MYQPFYTADLQRHQDSNSGFNNVDREFMTLTTALMRPSEQSRIETIITLRRHYKTNDLSTVTYRKYKVLIVSGVDKGNKDVDATTKGAVSTLVNGIQTSHASKATCSNGLERRSPDIKISPPMGKNLKGDKNFGILNWQVSLSFRARRHC
ncbi:hypothetical protein TNCV_3886791 [Trichonephila clavipes]|nr:hypothetical protein TNCV_3886791 [Trichonephila clavipes]